MAMFKVDLCCIVSYIAGMDDKNYISIQELSRRIDISQQHLRRLFRSGDLPGAVRIGPRMIRINWEEFQAKHIKNK